MTEDGPGVIEGTIRARDGTPLPRVRAVAHIRDVHGTKRIGESLTDLRGRYRIEYSGKALEADDAGVEIRVLREGARKPLATSPVIFDPESAATMDIEVTDVSRVPSEFERLRNALELAVGDVPPAELSEEQVAHVAAATGIDRGQLAMLAESERRAGDIGLPASLLYALLRAGLPMDADGLARHDAQSIGRAIDDALRRNLVPSELGAERDELVETRLPALQVEALLRPAEDGQPGSLGDLLATVLPEEKHRRTFARLLIARPAVDEEFWRELAARREFTRSKVVSLRDALELGALTGHHMPLVRELQRLAESGAATAPRDFAVYDAEGWAELVDAVGPPDEALGRTRAQKVKTYSEHLARAFEARYPTAVLAGRIEQGEVAVPDALRSDLGRFFHQNPEFELGVEPVSAFLAPDGDANLGAIGDVAELRDQLMRLERVVKVVPDDARAGHGPRHAAADVLLEEGFDSAHRIARVGERAFIARVAPRLAGGEAEAERILARAHQNAGLALALMARYSPVYNPTTPPSLPAPSVEADGAAMPESGIPDLRTLFGSLDFCHCEHCRSAYGPAAYLVDVLQFLADQKILDPLVAPGRRPDIEEIELTCENTNRKLPYVDLVNEVLEDAVDPPAVAAYPQTTWQEPELAAQPENVNAGAYQKLKAAKHPWTLPFDLWLEEARTYLGHMEVPRHELMERMRPAPRWSDAAIARERLGLSLEEAEVITSDIRQTAKPWEVWGLEEVGDVRDIRDGELVSGRWDAVLTERVSILLHQSRLECGELLNLLELRFINPDGVAPTVEGDECDFTQMSTPWLDAAGLYRLHRFVRLWRALGWSMHDLDRAITVSGAADPGFLIWLSHVERLREALGVPVTTLLSFWSPLDTHAYLDRARDDVPIPSPYERAFQNKSVLNPSSPALALNSQGTELETPFASDSTQTITANRAAVTAGLGISNADLARLLAAGVEDELSLANLSRLQRIVTLARALRLSVRDWLRVRAITGIDPFPPVWQLPDASAATLSFVEEARRIRDSGFTLDELDYLLRDRSSSAAPVGPSVDQRRALLGEIRDGLRRIAEETDVASDPRGEATGRFLGQLRWDAELIEALLSEEVLNHDPLTSVPLERLPSDLSFPVDLPEYLKGKVDFDGGAHRLTCLGALRPKERDVLRGLPQTQTGPQYKAYTKAVRQLFRESRKGVDERVAFVRKRMQSVDLPEFSAPVEWKADLASLPPGVELPQSLPKELRQRLTYDEHAEELRFRGLMSATERAKLVGLASDDPDWEAAIDELYVPIALPPALAERFHHDPQTGSLRFIGFMSEAEREKLRALSDAASYTDAVDALFDASDSHTEPAGENRFLTLADARAIFYDARSTDERFQIVLGKLLPILRRRRGERWVIQRLAAALAIAPETVRELARGIDWPRREGVASIEALLDPAFAESAPGVRLDEATFPDQHDACRLLHKAALVVSKLRVAPAEVATLLRRPHWEFLNALPLERSQGDRIQYEAWRSVVSLFALRDRLPAGSDVLARVFTTAEDASDSGPVLDALEELLGWDADDLAFAVTDERLGLPVASHYLDPERLTRVVDLYQRLGRLGVSAKQAADWCGPSLTAAGAAAIRQAVRGKMGPSDWLARARVLRDPLRERQRAALVDYLVARDDDMRDANDLYGRYLLDVEMDPCMLTSRIRQAMSSVQLYVQRCLMNLEPAVKPSQVPAKRWSWMRSYRIWEANRKVFFYPENWIEPELRADKSPIFAELGGALQQGDVTKEAAERAFLGYLEKLNDLSRLEIAGAARDPDKGDDTDVLHVFGRTFNAPRLYYYRRREETGRWTPWEKVDLDIGGDHLAPAVWNGQLYLFWLQFVEAAQEPATVPTKAEKPTKTTEMQLAFSVRRDGGWAAAQQLLRPQSFENPPAKAELFFAAPFVEPEVIKIGFGYPDIPPHYDDPVSDDWRFGWIELRQGKMQSGGMKESPPPIASPYVGVWSMVRLHGNAFVQQGVLTIPQATHSGGTMDRTSISDWFILFRSATWSNPHRLVFPQSAETWREDAGGHVVSFVGQDSFFFEHAHRTYHATPAWDRLTTGSTKPQTNRLRFSPHFHPYIPALMKAVDSGGLERLLSLELQALTDSGKVRFPYWETEEKHVPAGASFINEYTPNPAIIDETEMPKETVEFGAREPYASYNWELFFHAPFLVATQLSKNQRFEEARRWFHFIFNPTDDSGNEEPARFWRTRPFHEAGKTPPIQELVKLLATGSPPSARQDFVAQVKDWIEHPFDPHAIARWRPSAYQRAVVMRYIDNLINWGDQLFRRDTLESLNEATQLYVLANQILGPRPERIPHRDESQVHTYASLKDELDGLLNVLVEVEGIVPATNGGGGTPDTPLPTPYTLYFCIPHNEKILSYWNRVEDRLFKIRHCMDIEGRVRQLPLFEPPIDPALLVQAAAAGIDLGAVLGDANAPGPHYRFGVLAQKAGELCGEVKSLGAALLSALEKRDSERLALLRSEHEVELLEAMRTVRAAQVEEAKASLHVLIKGLELARGRLDYYLHLVSALEEVGVPSGSSPEVFERMNTALLDTALSGEAIAVIKTEDTGGQPQEASGKADLALEKVQAARRALELAEPVSQVALDALSEVEQTMSVSDAADQGDEAVTVPMNVLERRQLDSLKTSHDKQQAAKDYEALAQALSLVPDLQFGVQGAASSPVLQFSIGGTQLSRYFGLHANQRGYESSEHGYRANLHSILAGYQRRATEWIHQARQTVGEIEHQSRQIVAAALRLAITVQELRNHESQIENAREVDAYMREKYTNEELYEWLSGQLSSVYLSAYQLAYDVAKRAERAYRFELGARDATFIKFGYWDSLRKGLLAGERLHQDLRRMEVSYLDENRREHELSKDISLAQLDPAALIRLKLTGACEFEVPEALFDLDHPGHYMRRIKAVNLTVPCVTGPYTGVNCTLTLLRSSTRTSALVGTGYPRATAPDEDPRFVDDPGALQSIATSSGQADGGLFEANLRDERYLPCEGYGAISRWRLELPSEFRQFDYDTISDVIVHLRYTARDGGRVLADKTVEALRNDLDGLMRSADREAGFARLFSLRHEFAGWSRLFAEAGDRTLTLDLAKRFPLLFRGRRLLIYRVDLFARGRADLEGDLSAHQTALRKAELGDDQLDGLRPWEGRDDVLHVSLADLQWDPTEERHLSFDGVELDDPGVINDLWLVCYYTVDAGI